MTFRHAIATLLKLLFVKILMPGCFWGPTHLAGVVRRGWLGKTLRDTGVAYSEFEVGLPVLGL